MAFLLTTNRPDILEPALAARPALVDLAVEIGLPDAEGRRRLLELYAVGLDLRIEDPAAVIARTDGVSPAFIKELLRKASLLAARGHAQRRPGGPMPRSRPALDELLAESEALTRVLLGSATDRLPPTTRASMGWLPGATEPSGTATVHRRGQRPGQEL